MMFKHQRKMLKRQGGVAVITALLLTTLAVSIVASLFWQQQVQVRSMENQRLQQQTKWILRGALDWSTIVLRQDGYDHQLYTSLDHVWATPLAETRLDQYIERERVQGENFDATLSGSITDATARYNLRNLADNGQRNDAQVAVFARLLQNLQVNPQLALQTANVVALSQPAELPAEGDHGDGSTPPPQQPPPQTPPQQPAVRNSGTAPMKLLQVDDLLAVPGFTPAMVEKLRPFVIVLPEITPVNVNTAPAEVLAAVVPNFSVTQANSLVAARKTAAWTTLDMFKSQVNSADLDASVASVHSDWFLVQSHIRLDRAALDAESLVRRKGMIGGTSVVWTRQN